MHYHRNRLKWKIRNNYVFFIIMVIICAIIGLLFGVEMFNFERVKSMEAILDKSTKTIHRKTGMTDEDVAKLKKAHPDFNWEGTWDRQRWLEGTKTSRQKRSEREAKKDFQFRRK